MSKHYCNESCVCPIDGKLLIYNEAGNDHACLDSNCFYASGINSRKTKITNLKLPPCEKETDETS